MRSALLPLILLTLVGCQPTEPQVIQGKTMGTTWSLRAYGADEKARQLIQTHLDQREAAEIFGGGVNAFSRYENGKTKPPLALLKLLKVLDRHPELLEEIKAA